MNKQHKYHISKQKLILNRATFIGAPSPSRNSYYVQIWLLHFTIYFADSKLKLDFLNCNKSLTRISKLISLAILCPPKIRYGGKSNIVFETSNQYCFEHVFFHVV